MRQYPPELTAWFGQYPAAGTGLIEIAGRLYQVQEGSPHATHVGLFLWPSAVLLAREVALRGLVHDYWRDRTVLELGAGCAGLPGTLAHHTGARAVTFVEAEPLTAERLLLTTLRHGLPARVRVEDWSETITAADVILGSEIIYPAMGLAELAAAIARCWTGAGPCLLANAPPSTSLRKQSDSDFTAALATHGLSAEIRTLDGVHLDGRPLSVDLWDLSRR